MTARQSFLPAAKLKRLAAMGNILKHADDWRSRSALLRAYLSTLYSTTSKTEVSCGLRIGSRRFPVRMRLSDVFVLEEVLLEKQYELQTPLGSTPTIIDAGANIGLSTLWLMATYPDATIHAFEPDPENHRLLRSNVGQLPAVSAANVALGATTSKATLHLAAHGAMHSLKSADVATQPSVEVECIRLSDYLAHHHIDRVDLLKLDVEGSELDVLKGLGERLDRVEVIIGELHEAAVDPAEFYGYLDAWGFRKLSRPDEGRTGEAGIQLFEVVRRTHR